MTTTFSWNISNLDHHLPDEIVYTVHWTLTAEQIDGDSTYTAGSYGTVSLRAPEDNIIPYEDLTPDIVIQWTKDALGAEKIAEIEQHLTEELENQKDPQEASGLPW